jgi:hypothetical protein
MSTTEGGDGKVVVQFPLSADERKQLRKAKQDHERQKLINRFAEEQDLFRTPDGTTFADLVVEGIRQTWPIRSKQFKNEYIRFLRRQIGPLLDTDPIAALFVGSALTKAAINKGIDDFDMRATCSPIERKVHVRVAQDGADFYIDLCDPGWHAIRITSLGWSVVQSPPVRFRRAIGMQSLPFPERGKSINLLRPFLNVSDSDFILVVAFMLTALRPFLKYPIYICYGMHGSAKTDLLRIIRSLVDPSEAATTPLPLSGRDLFISAKNSHMQAFENVSNLSRAMSDFLCRLATGGAFRMRRLFSDGDETLFAGARPIMLEGIANVAVEADMLSRAIICTIDPLRTRKLDSVLAEELARARPGILGALLDMAVVGIRQGPETRLDDPPRMYDFAHWAVACGVTDFEKSYAGNRQNAINVILAHDALASSLRALLAKRPRWAGTAQGLFDELGPSIKVANAKVLSDDLRRLAPMLLTIGIELQFDRKNIHRMITIEQR